MRWQHSSFSGVYRRLNSDVQSNLRLWRAF
jgi:hypothetical protein